MLVVRHHVHKQWKDEIVNFGGDSLHIRMH